MLILCGSAFSSMEKKILSEKSPIFGRRNPRSGWKPWSQYYKAFFPNGRIFFRWNEKPPDTGIHESDSCKQCLENCVQRDNLKTDLHLIMDRVFEEMCRYYTLEKGIRGEFGSFHLIVKYLLFSLHGFSECFSSMDNPNIALIILPEMYVWQI